MSFQYLSLIFVFASQAVVLRGGRFLEAPVCGSRVPALEGQLVILASGDRKLYEDCHSSFEAMGKRSFFLGITFNFIFNIQYN